MKNQIAFRFTSPMNDVKLPLAVSLPVLALLLCAGSALGANQTWTNAPVSSAWTNINNWIGRAVPGGVNLTGTTLNNDIATFNSPLAGGIGGEANPIITDDATQISTAGPRSRQIGGIIFDGTTCGAYVVMNPSPVQVNDTNFLFTGVLYVTHNGGIFLTNGVANNQRILVPLYTRLPNSTAGVYNFVNNSTNAGTLYIASAVNDSANTRGTLWTLDGSNTGTNTIASLSAGTTTTGANGLTKQGAGTWILSGANDFRSQTVVRITEGTLIVKDAACFGSTTFATSVTITNGVLQIQGVDLPQLSLTLQKGGTIRITGTNSLNGVAVGAQTGNSATLATISSSDLITVGSGISTAAFVTGGAADSVLNTAGPGTFVFGAANPYIGKWSFGAATNQISAATALGTGQNANVAAGAILDLTPLGATTFTPTTTGIGGSGTGTAIGSTAAAVLADPGATLNMGGKVFNLTFTPTAFNGDTTHPALYIAQGTLSLDANGFNVNNNSGTPLGIGTYRLIQQATGNIVNGRTGYAIVSGAGLAANTVAEVEVSGGNVTLVVVAHVAVNLRWKGGNPDNKWDKLASANFDNGTGFAPFSTGDAATFDYLGAAFPSVDLVGTLLPASVKVDNTNDYAFSGSGLIAGPTSLSKSGTGALSLGTVNVYVGGTVVSNGTLRLGVAEAISSFGAGNVAVYNPGVIDLNGFANTLDGLDGTGTVDNQGGGSSVLTVGNNDKSGNFSGVLKNTGGALAVTKIGTGTQSLSASNAYTGATTINAGTLTVSNAYALGPVSDLTMADGTLDVRTTRLYLNSLAGAGGTIINNGTASTNTLVIQGAQTTTFAGSIVDAASGKMALLMLAGTMRLNGANTFTNGTIVGSGATLQIGNNPANLAGFVIASNTATLGLAGGTAAPGTPASITTVDGATVLFTSLAEGNGWGGQFFGSATTTNRYTGACTVSGALSFSNFLGVVQLALDNAANPNFRFNNAIGGGDNTTFEFQSGLVHTRDSQTVRIGSIRGGSPTCGIGGTGTAGQIGTWLIGGKNVDNTFHGYISGSNNVVKIGTGSLTFDGVTAVTNTDNATYTNLLYSPGINYTGTTTVSNGLMAVVAPNTLSNSSLITLAAATAVLDASQMGYVSNLVDETSTPTNSFIVTNGVFALNAGQTLAGSGILKANGVISRGAINPGFTGAGGTLSISNGLSIQGGATNFFDLSDDLTGVTKPSDLIRVQGDVNLSGSSVVAIGALNGVVKVGVYPLIKYTGALKNESGTVPPGPIPNFVLGGTFTDTSRATMVLSNAPGEVDLVVVSINSHNLTWTGDGVSNLWDVVTSVDWNDGGNASKFYQLDGVTFDDSTVNYSVGLQGFLAPSAITVTTTATNYLWGGTGSIGGTPTLIKQGSGGLILTNGANSYSGGTIINSGLLELGMDSGGNQNDLGLGTGPVSINGATAQLRFGGNSGAVVNHFITNAITLNGGTLKVQDGVQHLTNSTVSVTAAGGNLQTTWATKNLVLESPLTGSGVLTVSAANTGTNAVGGQVILSNSVNTFSGSVVIATNGNLALGGLAGLSNSVSIEVQLGGTLDVSGRTSTASTLTLQSGQTLKGSGVVRGSVVALSGSTVSPGTSIGTLTITNSIAHSITLAGLTYMEIDRAATPNNSDRIVATNIIAGGTLTVANLGAAPVLNDSFQLFSRGISNAFATINPPALSTGLAWSNSLALNGRLTVVPAVNATPTNLAYSVSGGILTLSWPSDHTGWRLLAQTNKLDLGISLNTNDWGTVAGSAATNKVSIPIDPAKPTEFYRMVYP